MRGSRLSLLGTAVAGVVALVVTLAPPAAAAGANYVALGDSYSSGVGAGDYLASGGNCQRSPHAYSQLWAEANAPASYTSVACGGARTVDVINNQLSALSADTTLISMSIGGNDVGFGNVIKDCVLYGTSTCVSEINDAENQARNTLPGQLDALYSAIQGRSPNARVVIMDYPRFYDTSGWFCIGLSDTARNKINEGADVLAEVTQTVAGNHGFAFGDVRPAFANDHEICDGSSSWLHSVDAGDIGSSYHPTAAGQSGGYLPVFSAQAG